MDREYQIILYGATGFTGKLCAEYLRDNYPEIKWAIAGRNNQKLNDLKNTLNLKPGQVHTIKFNVENPSNQISSGSASFNVSPSSFGKYLNKIGCFCFEKQTLKPNEKQEFVLTFFLDPKVVDDNKTKNISDVTLSFTFFASEFYEKGKI